jgi:ABC-3C biological conflict system middle component
MILPGKHLREDRALLSIGGEILRQLDEPRTVSELWERVRVARSGLTLIAPLPFDWFVLALNLLYAMSALELSGGVVMKVEPS